MLNSLNELKLINMCFAGTISYIPNELKAIMNDFLSGNQFHPGSRGVLCITGEMPLEMF